MGLFDIFRKKKKVDYDPTNLKLTDLNKGFMVDFDLKTWEVVEGYEYDWGNDYFSYEFKLFNGEDTVYLAMEEDEKLNLIICKKIKIRALDENLPEFIEKNQYPPNKIFFNGENYFRDKESPGFFRNLEDPPEDAVEFISWDYYNQDETLNITIEQWGEREFEASTGKIVQEYEFSNIIPAVQSK